MSTAVSVRTFPPVRSASDLFFAQLTDATQRVLLLDYDGTIAPFSVHRDRAYPYPEVARLIERIMSGCCTRVVFISGRLAREIPLLLGLDPHPEIWGTYGSERLYPDGRYELAHVGDDVEHAMAEADAWLQEEGLDGLAEMKPGAVAIHWRGLDSRHVEEVKAKAYRVLSPLAFQTNLLLAEFDGGLELRIRNRSKADAVNTILSEIGDQPVAYLGDDRTDEDAFRALRERGLTVLVRPTYRFTAAQVWLRPPDELVQFLTGWIRACGGECE
jgi:trehalose 6-phosphate phosphatase